MNTFDLKRLFLEAANQLQAIKPKEGPGSDAVLHVIEDPVGKHPIIVQTATTLEYTAGGYLTIFCTLRYAVESDERELTGKSIVIATHLAREQYDPSKSLDEHDVYADGALQGPLNTLVDEDESVMHARLQGGMSRSLQLAVDNPWPKEQLLDLIRNALSPEGTPGCDCSVCRAKRVSLAKAGVEAVREEVEAIIEKTVGSTREVPTPLIDVADIMPGPGDTVH